MKDSGRRRISCSKAFRSALSGTSRRLAEPSRPWWLQAAGGEWAQAAPSAMESDVAARWHMMAPRVLAKDANGASRLQPGDLERKRPTTET
jgi:hypothetical protein